MPAMLKVTACCSCCSSEAVSKDAAADALYAKHMRLFVVALMYVATFSVLGMWTTFWPIVWVAVPAALFAMVAAGLIGTAPTALSNDTQKPRAGAIKMCAIASLVLTVISFIAAAGLGGEMVKQARTWDAEIDKAFNCDHVIVSGRVKPHTGFVGPIESGLHKMMLIGLGKHAGAKIYHRAILDHSFLEIIRAVGDCVVEKCGILAGVAIVENAYDETGMIAAVAPEDFYERECDLLKTATAWMPTLPFKEIGLLIVDEIGKNISGTGMDTNIIGRKYNDHAATDKDDFKVKRIFVRGLTEATHGNATGLGMAEFTNCRTVESVDQKITQINCITGNHPSAAAIPCHFETDREVIENALPTTGLVEPENAKVVQVPDTLTLGEVLVSEAFIDQVKAADGLEVVSGPDEMAFDLAGNLAPVLTERSH